MTPIEPTSKIVKIKSYLWYELAAGRDALNNPLIREAIVGFPALFFNFARVRSLPFSISMLLRQTMAHRH